MSLEPDRAVGQVTERVTERVLVVEDDDALAENLVELLAGLGTPIVRATSLREATAATAAGQVLVALVDLRLPDGSGGELVRRLRASSPATRVVLVTGDAAVESAAAAVSDGAFAYLLKPFAAPVLLDTVRRARAEARLLLEQERLRQELEDSERRHRQLVEAVPAFVVALDDAGRIVVWNRRLEEATGLSRARMLGQDGRALVAGEGPVELPAADGAPRLLVRWERAVVGGDELAGGGSAGVAMTYAVGIDVTREQEMSRRTLRAERLAAVGTLAAGLAHEIRNPLNAAALQLALLSRRLDKLGVERATLDPVLEVIGSEIGRLERLVSDFLAFARPFQLALAELSLVELCQSVVELIAPELEAAGVRLQTEFAADAPRVRADGERIKQVVLNLVRNALEALASRGGGTVSLRCRAAPDGRAALVEVADDGPGIPADAQVFDAFFTTKPQGTGLGLSLAHRIVTDHGGEIGYTSRPGQTCFSFTLPAGCAPG